MDKLGLLRRAAKAEDHTDPVEPDTPPVEPEHVKFTRKSLQYAPPPTEASRRSYRQDKELIDYIDSLQSALQVAQQERDGYLDLNRDCAELALNHLERELADAKEQLRLCNVDQFTTAAELAEANARLDWLDTVECGIFHRGYGEYRYYIGEGFTKKAREVIDAAMKEGGK